MRIFSKNKKESPPSARSFSVGNVEKTSSSQTGPQSPYKDAVSPKKQYIINNNDDAFLKAPPSMGSALTERKRSSSLNNMMRILSVGNSSPPSDSVTNESNSPSDNPGFHQTINFETHSISPELVPIVTLLSAQAHRRYHVGVFLLFQDLSNDGTPAERVWNEQYGVLIGNQLALWNSKDLEQNNLMVDKKKTQQELAHDLFHVASKPKYLNFTDAKFKQLESKANTLVVSTTMKNRYFMKFSDSKSFNIWHSALRLSAFEYSSLQEAYTGAFLSSKGAKLSDIKVILADSKFNYEDWVSVRFGAGMPWKRCYAVVTPGKSSSKKKGKTTYGEVVFYESNKKISNKKYAMATVTSAYTIFATYPSSPLLIDNSTMLKIEGEIEFNDDGKASKKSKHNSSEQKKEGDIFIMPEKHNGVPGYDTIIRFLVPMLNSFHLYGRPERLISARDDLDSLLFGLPTLPEIHYLQVNDLKPLIQNSNSGQWNSKQWRDEIKQLLFTKLLKGYSGCGSASGYSGAVMTGSITTGELFGNTNSPKMQPIARFVSGSESPQKNIESPRKLASNLQQTSNSESQVIAPASSPSPLARKPQSALGLSINPPDSFSSNSKSSNYYDQPKTPVMETTTMNIPQFKNSQNNLKISTDDNSTKKLAAETKRSPYHQYKSTNIISDTKASVDKLDFNDTIKITSNPVSVGKASGANAAAFSAAAPSPEIVHEKHSSKKHSASLSRASGSSNISIIDSYAHGAQNNAFSKPTSGLGIVSSTNATPKKMQKYEKSEKLEDDYVVKTTDDPLADFYKLSRTLSNFNTLEKFDSNKKDNQQQERPTAIPKQSQSSVKTATRAAKKYVDDGLPEDFGNIDSFSRSNDDIFYDAPQLGSGSNLKKSPQVKNISSFVNDSDATPPTIMASPNMRKNNGFEREQQKQTLQQQSAQQQNYTTPQQNIYKSKPQHSTQTHGNYQQQHAMQNHPTKQPQVNTNPYYKQHQKALNINSQTPGKPMPPQHQGHPINYQQQRQYSPVQSQPMFMPQQVNKKMNSPYQVSLNNGNNGYMQHQPQKPYLQQRNMSNGSINGKNDIPSKQYKSNAGGFSQFMPTSQISNPYGN